MEKARLSELMEYRDGDMYWTKPTSVRVRAGDLVGTMRPDGYVQVQIDNKMYRLHHLVWLWHYGVMPHGEVDHINRVRDDNRIENLRIVDRMDNAANNGARNYYYAADNGSKPWVALIQRRGVRIRRPFATEAEAQDFVASAR